MTDLVGVELVGTRSIDGALKINTSDDGGVVPDDDVLVGAEAEQIHVDLGWGRGWRLQNRDRRHRRWTEVVAQR